MNPRKLLEELILLPGPPGQEEQVREAIAIHCRELGLEPQVDAKGNLLVALGSGRPRVVVTAHLDEIALMVSQILPDGSLAVRPLGGIHPWKLGEGPVQILASDADLDGVLSFGSVHTESPQSPVRHARENPMTWDLAKVVTGLRVEELTKAGVRPGTRVVVHPSGRTLTDLGDLVAGYFMDDRADLVAWLLALEELRHEEINVLFAATVSEEVGGEGALYLLHEHRPDVCIALELGPNVPDAPVEISDQPTVWVTDSYASMAASDIELLARLNPDLQFQALSRGGSDASCAASHGLCARPITLGIPMENTHGYEIIHPNAMVNLAKLTVDLVHELLQTP